MSEILLTLVSDSLFVEFLFGVKRIENRFIMSKILQKLLIFIIYVFRVPNQDLGDVVTVGASILDSTTGKNFLVALLIPSLRDKVRNPLDLDVSIPDCRGHFHV